jgi:hypothetical protein
VTSIANSCATRSSGVGGARADRDGLGRGRGGGGRDERGEPGALIGEERGEAGALLLAGGGETVERLRPAGEDGTAAGGDNGLGIVLDGLNDAAHGEEAVEARRRGVNVARQLAQQGDDLVEHRPVDANRGRRQARDGERRRDVAAAAALSEGGAQLRLQRLEAGRQAQPQFERAAVDAAQFPDPGDAVGLALGAGEAGHAGDAHAPALGCYAAAPL